ncbi:MAG: Amidohydrolase [Synergistales bacterium 57_84]|nr:MAG: Amidohydrolase [Synergistales bacterium 57_84]
MQARIREMLERERENILSVYRDLHAIPELSAQEYRTSAYIADYLEKRGFQVQRGVGGTGLVSYLRGEDPGPVLGIRADMDALGHLVDGEIQAIHSCGLFQPSEEQEETSGARAMIADGVLEDMDMCIGIHLRPIQEARYGQAVSALKHGALATVTAEITGATAHGGRPHLGKNVVDALAAIVNAVNAIWVDPTVPASAKVTALNAGGANYSSIPEKGEMGADLRANTNEVMEELLEKVEHAIRTGASTIGCSADVRRVPGLPAAVFDRDMIRIADEAIRETLGDEGALGERGTTGAEDFHEYVKAKPELRTTYIGLGCDLEPGLHHPEMSFRQDALLDGVAILANMAGRILG